MTDEVRGYLDYVARINDIMARKEQLERVMAAAHGRENKALAIWEWLEGSDRPAESMTAMLFVLNDYVRLWEKKIRRTHHLPEDGE